MKINLYDFDKTIYKGDSSTDFFFFALSKYPKIIKVVPKIIVSAIKYKLKLITKTEMKETIFSFLQYVDDLDSLLWSFWSSHEIYIKDFFVDNENHENDIILTASPEFLLERMLGMFGVKETIGSRVDPKTGRFTGENCYGEEKVRRLNEKYKNYKVMEAYSDSLSDLPMLKLAKKSFIVKKYKITEKHFK